jgi:hypothetical protein
MQRQPKTFYVSTGGSDAHDGTAPESAFRSIQTGINHLEGPGDKLRIFGGTNTESVKVSGKTGSSGHLIVIEGMPGVAPGPVVIIQGSITNLSGTTETFNFHQAPNQEWQPASGPDAHPQEYISCKSLPSPTGNTNWFVNRGAFVQPINGRYTRLITYSHLEDLRAVNQTYEPIFEGTGPGCTGTDPRPGPTLGEASGCTERRPWVYMGPGIWFDQSSKKVHIRLSPRTMQ